ncbi:MAG: quinolinate synthase NadA [Micromonosporaceae bacterium]|nr:quinolinate synthase NadA [Micromonosporaceae bacterium]
MKGVTLDAASSTATALFLLGQASDPAPEAGVTCPGALPAPNDPGLVARAQRAKAALGDRVVVLGHHYQRDDVIAFADVTGDSFKLARDAAANPRAEYVVFCGVHFMAESADILTGDHQQVVLPDLEAGCSMADLASLAQVERCWQHLEDLGVTGVVPVTYMNSTAAIKGFVGARGGIVCTSSNAERVLRWAFERGQRVLFLPDEHLGRNTAVLGLGMSRADCVVYDPNQPDGLTPAQLLEAKMILWRGHCSVHQRFSASGITEVRRLLPGIRVIAHPECRYEVVAEADEVGSTEAIIRAVEASPSGSAWAIATELNLVSRLAHQHPDKQIVFADRTVCYCSTMNRIDLPHLVLALETLAEGRAVNRITVDRTTAANARLALDRMLMLP